METRTKKRKDPRANLPVAYAKLVGALNNEFGLDFFLFENVIGLKGENHRYRLAQIRREFRRAGFQLFEAELDAQNFGVAQRRRRLINTASTAYFASQPQWQQTTFAGLNEVLRGSKAMICCTPSVDNRRFNKMAFAPSCCQRCCIVNGRNNSRVLKRL